MRARLLAALAVLFWPHLGSAQNRWVNRSHEFFFPASLKSQLTPTSEFSQFWWNFVVFDYQDKSQGLQKAHEFCDEIKDQPLVRKSSCTNNLSAFLPLIQDWASHLSLRGPMPKDLDAQLNASQGLIAMAGTAELIPILRVDPLQSFEDLIQRLTNNQSLDFKKEQGFWIDEEAQRIALAIQMDFAPTETGKTGQFFSSLKNRDFVMVGPHGPTLENESRIRADIQRISTIGTLLLILQIIFAVWTRRTRLLWLAPPVIGSVALATVLIVLIYGSIHALTLAFGVGLIGIGLDYGLHSCFNIGWKRVWKANFFGLLTTLVAFIVIAFSNIPLLQQMMVFASLGVIFCCVFYQWLHTRYPSHFAVPAFKLSPKTNRARTAAALLLVAAAPVGLFWTEPQFGLQQFNYQTQRSRDVFAWFFSHAKAKNAYLTITPASSNTLDEFQKLEKWSEDQKIEATTLLDFLPPSELQAENLKSWKAFSKKTWSETDRKLWSPFIDRLQKDVITSQTLNTRTPEYLKDIRSSTSWLTVWLPTNAEQGQKIKEAFPDSFSLPEATRSFSENLTREMQWMIPISCAIALLLLYLYFKSVFLSLISIIPFAAGVGLYFIASIVFQWSISFISMIALIMVFGMSIDYGIFAASSLIEDNKDNVHGVWTCLWLAALVTIFGFLPLAFAHHPVLQHLGQTLSIGTLGTLIGTIWGIPGVLKLSGYIK